MSRGRLDCRFLGSWGRGWGSQRCRCEEVKRKKNFIDGIHGNRLSVVNNFEDGCHRDSSAQPHSTLSRGSADVEHIACRL
ncbi:hypothetical protein Mapa_012657 [Marchantia paleacea]|nr:hypothetical protein Mapa_012657 [Marchantia paleacea]